MWRFLAAVAVLLLVALGVMYWLDLPPFGALSVAAGTGGQVSPGEKELTTPRMAEGPSKRPLQPMQPFKDPISIRAALVTLIEEADLAATFDRDIREILVELGAPVRRGQLLGRLDDTQARNAEDAATLKAMSDKKIKTADAKHKTAARIVDADRIAGRAVSENDKDIHEFQMLSALYEFLQAQEDRAYAEKELAKARTDREEHRIVSPINGHVQKIYRKTGERARPGEPLFRVCNYDRLRVEGSVPAQLAPYIKVGMRCTVEPERLLDPLSELRGHTGAINCLAVTPDGLLLASASDDQTVILWGGLGRRWDTLHDTVPLYAVAAAKPEKDDSANTTYTFLTGGANGRVRLWRITVNAQRLRVKKDHVDVSHDEAHRSGDIKAVAFSPDGKTFATGGDHSLCIWKLKDGQPEFQYRVEESKGEAAHRGTVTTLHISQAEDGDLYLVSAGTDQALKRWKLGPQFAQLDYRQKDRTGDVPKLGVSPDGQRCLFDAGDKLWVIDFSQREVVGTLDSGGRGQFSSLALFTPSGQTVLTANSGGRVQLYALPTPPAEAAFFRQAYAHGFRRNSLLALGALGAGVSEDGLLLMPGALATCGEQPKQAPAPQVTAAVPTLSPVAHMLYPTVLVDTHDYRGLTAVPECWPLQGFELQHLVTPDASAVTCAAFIPEAPGFAGKTILFTGGADKLVRVWELPPASERADTLEAVITAVGRQVETGNDVLVRAELDNPTTQGARLYARSKVNLTIYPEMAPKK